MGLAAPLLPVLLLQAGSGASPPGGGYELKALEPFGAEVRGIDLRKRPPEAVLTQLEFDLARTGFLVFPEQGSLSAAELTEVSRCFGGRELLSRHSVHPEALSEDVLRLSNREERGIPLVGPQWHSDGSTERAAFSHVVFHAISMPLEGGETDFADLAKIFESLPPDSKKDWSQLASVNAYSGAVHPLVHRHPISNRPVLFLHLGQTGAIIRWPESSMEMQNFNDNTDRLWSGVDSMHPNAGQNLKGRGYHVLNEEEMVDLLHRYDELLSRREHRLRYRYHAGDLVIVDNLAVAHRATPSAHDAKNGLRIVHRTTVKGTRPLDPPALSGLPPFLYIFGENPFCDGGVWKSSDYYGVGFRWNESVALRN